MLKPNLKIIYLYIACIQTDILSWYMCMLQSVYGVRVWTPFHEWKAHSSIIERSLQFVSKVWCCNCTLRKKRNDTKRSYDIRYLNSKIIIMKGGQFGKPHCLASFNFAHSGSSSFLIKYYSKARSTNANQSIELVVLLWRQVTTTDRTHANWVREMSTASLYFVEAALELFRSPSYRPHHSSGGLQSTKGRPRSKEDQHLTTFQNKRNSNTNKKKKYLWRTCLINLICWIHPRWACLRLWPE